MGQWLARRMAVQGRTPALLRLHALWATACGAGLRPAELVAARLSWLRLATPDQRRRGIVALWLDVPASATAGQARSIALDDGVRDALQCHLGSRQRCLPAEGRPVADGDAPLFAQLRAERPLSPARLYEVMSQAFAACADDLAPCEPQAAAALRGASTHWLRHGFGLQAALAGAPAPELQQRMGHRSRASAAAYRQVARAVKTASPMPGED